MLTQYRYVFFPASFSCYVDLVDAGGPRGISQLKILEQMMNLRNVGVEDDQKKRPCTVFDMIGGVGSGG